MSPKERLNKNCSFHGQDADEEILYVIHRHWFNILSQFVPFFIGLFLLIGSFVFFKVFSLETSQSISQPIFLFIESILLIFLWIFGFLVWIDYYLDVWIITDKRIVNIEQKGLFVRNMSEIFLFRIQDITSEVKGFFPSILDFGDVYVQSAGERERFQFHKIPNPYKIKDIIMDMTRDTHQQEMEFMERAFQNSGTGKRKTSVNEKEAS